jgi:hypothetical protein
MRLNRMAIISRTLRVIMNAGRNGEGLGSARLVAIGYPSRIASTEYDQWPRGRIVYETARCIDARIVGEHHAHLSRLLLLDRIG